MKTVDRNPALCTSCGGPRNHYIDGKLRPKCSGCNDYDSRKKEAKTGSKSGPSTYVSSRNPIPDLTPQARDLLRQIDELLEDESYMWAEETLSGIHTTVSKSGRCSEGQCEAVQNIEDARSRRRGKH